MPSDKELEEAAAQLSQFRVKDDEYHRNHAEILDNDFEEARDSRERYKHLAKGGERNPFVLVLVDGDNYIFDNDLLESKAEGGARAAQLLNDALQRSLRDRPGLESCGIMVRIYANIAGLSKALSKAGLTGPEKRSLTPFVANFNRSNGLFDFVDAGELKENADSKIRSLFRHFVENTQCRHIYFAACHDVGYINELTSYTMQRDRITLVRNYAFHKEFTKLGLRVEEFPGIFKSSAIPGIPDLTTTTKHAPAPMSLASLDPSASSADSREVCTFFQKGLCKYGKGCKFAHFKATTGANTLPSPSDTQDWRDTKKMTLSPLVGRGMQEEHLAGINHQAIEKPPGYTILPAEDCIPQNKIPVNIHDERVDPYLPPVNSYDRALFKAQVMKQKLCNGQQLLSYCSAGATCPYDHTPMPENIKRCLRETAHCQPCPRKNTCRSLTCLYGHICQKQDCRYRGGGAFCKFPYAVHGIDMTCAKFVPGTNGRLDENGSVNGNGKESSPSYSSDEEVN